MPIGSVQVKLCDSAADADAAIGSRRSSTSPAAQVCRVGCSHGAVRACIADALVDGALRAPLPPIAPLSQRPGAFYVPLMDAAPPNDALDPARLRLARDNSSTAWSAERLTTTLDFLNQTHLSDTPDAASSAASMPSASAPAQVQHVPTPVSAPPFELVESFTLASLRGTGAGAGMLGAPASVSTASPTATAAATSAAPPASSALPSVSAIATSAASAEVRSCAARRAGARPILTLPSHARFPQVPDGGSAGTDVFAGLLPACMPWPSNWPMAPSSIDAAYVSAGGIGDPYSAELEATWGGAWHGELPPST